MNFISAAGSPFFICLSNCPGLISIYQYRSDFSIENLCESLSTTRATCPYAVIIKSYTNLVRKSERKNPLDKPERK
jgi:hypothetical protein